GHPARRGLLARVRAPRARALPADRGRHARRPPRPRYLARRDARGPDEAPDPRAHRPGTRRVARYLRRALPRGVPAEIGILGCVAGGADRSERAAAPASVSRRGAVTVDPV